MIQEELYLTVEEFKRFSDFVYQKIGVRFETQKMYFFSKRVEKRLKELRIESPHDYYYLLKFSDHKGVEFQNFVNLLTINETYFFRDYPQLETLAENCLPEIIDKKVSMGDRNLRIWSAGCSTGEEPYTIGIILHEILDDVSRWNIEIMATDIDKIVLQKAEAGLFDKRSVKDVPQEYLDRYFKKSHGDTFAIRQEIKDLVKFEHLNLGDPSALRSRKGFDIILCRNVLIYFDDLSRKHVVDHFFVALNRGGFIFLGSSESLGRITTAFQMRRLGKNLVYCKV